MSKIKITEFNLFFLVWAAIMFAGANFPPPKGFVNIVILILILDVFQHFYLCWLLPRLNKQNTFILNLGLFATVQIAVALMMISLSGKFYPGTIVWIAIIAVVSVLYGSFFWVANWMIVKKKGNI